MELIYIILAAIVGGGVMYTAISRIRCKNEGFEKEAGSSDLIATQSLEKEENLAQVMHLFDTKDEIANDDVENTLGVSDATASRYLSELEEQGQVKQIGETGHAVTYKKVI
ncbi:MAG: helix-turn-helix domain-containing protein [Candidatus Paceibacterota bacterium]